MEVTVDKVGRFVIPKRLRTAHGIEPDSKLEIIECGVRRLGRARRHADKRVLLTRDERAERIYRRVSVRYELDTGPA